jgi:hypothetical protein
MSNRVTLEQLPTMPMEVLVKLPLVQIMMLLEDVAAMKANVKACDNILLQVLTKLFAERAATLRKAKGSDTGTVSFKIEDVKIAADLPKAVTWDQPKLKEAVAKIRAMGEDPDEYVSIEVKVSEAKFNAWPKALRDIFVPARTLGVGRPTFKLELQKKAA